MKTKNNYSFLANFIVAGVCLLALIPVRIYQYFKVLEPETGFYSKIDFSVYAVYILMAVVIIFSIATAVISRKSLKIKINPLTNISGAAASAVGALGFVYDAICRFTEYFAITKAYIPDPEKTYQAYLSENGAYFIIFEAVFAVVSAVYLFALAGGAASRKNVAPSVKYIALALPLWTIFRLLLKFKVKISFINVSELFISLFATAFVMLFLLYFAQTVSDVDKGATFFKMYAYGFPGAILSLCCFIPRIILAIIGRDDLICPGYEPDFTDLLLSLMIISLLILFSYDTKQLKKSGK